MLTPVRLIASLRPNVSRGVISATAISTIVFSATPFLIRGISADRGIAIGQVGLISTAQLSGFVIASWAAGRVLRPRRRVMLLAAILGVLANIASGFVPGFGLLVATRVISGISLGLTAWISWAEVFGDDDRVGDVAVIGPLVGTAASPVIAMVIDSFGVDTLFVALGILHLVPLAFVRSTSLQSSGRPKRKRHRPTRDALIILFCLGFMTLGGSAVFIYIAAIGQDIIGLSPLVVSLAFSANALASVPSARFRGARNLPGLWIGLTAVAAVLVAAVHNAVAFWIAMPLWGFAFWMAVPGAFSLLAERSAYPDERAGDAQAVMAAGRVIGPLLGGALFAISPATLGIVGGAIMGWSATTMLYLERQIRV